MKKSPALQVLIVDDEALARKRLRNLLADCSDPSVQIVGEAANVAAAKTFLANLMPSCWTLTYLTQTVYRWHAQCRAWQMLLTSQTWWHLPLFL